MAFPSLMAATLTPTWSTTSVALWAALVMAMTGPRADTVSSGQEESALLVSQDALVHSHTVGILQMCVKSVG